MRARLLKNFVKSVRILWKLNCSAKGLHYLRLLSCSFDLFISQVMTLKISEMNVLGCILIAITMCYHGDFQAWLISVVKLHTVMLEDACIINNIPAFLPNNDPWTLIVVTSLTNYIMLVYGVPYITIMCNVLVLINI